MKFDRNTVIGFVALAVLFIGYFIYNSKEQQAFMKQKARQDSILNASKPKTDTLALKQDSARQDTLKNNINTGGFQQVTGTEEIDTVENTVMTIAFTSKGGHPKWVELKSFKDQNKRLVRLASTDFDKFSYDINVAMNKSMPIEDLNFNKAIRTKNDDGTQTLSFKLSGTDSSANMGESIVHQYVIRPDDYMIDFNILLNGADKLLTQSTMNVIWQSKALQLEKDLKYEKQQSQIGYRLNGDFDYHTISVRNSKEFNNPVQWVAVKQQFFNTTLIAKNNFSSGKIEWVVPSDTQTVVQATANLRLTVPSSSATIPFSLYYGPNDYKLLKKYGMEMENLVNLGQGIFAFVKYINRWIVLPFFDLIKRFINSYGIVILLLTIFIRLIISPLTYTSYLSGAKMKVLRPEIAALKEKYGNDQQQISMEQMKLFREAGVNPLGGCIPALLQIPIFFALYSFFNSNVALRGKSFLWATDLSSYDSILNLGFNIPWYGSHVSLFTITAVVTSFLISLYSMSMTPDQSNPVLKYMPYIFPFFLLFIFNKLPSALTWYYTVSNMITLALQWVILNYIIDHEKILAKMQANRKKPKGKSKWQERLEQMQETQKKVKEMQQKNKR
jgi:YidC/Oxa1 family membrane protein insertase